MESQTPVAMVTGASSGLGRGLALALVREGWKVGLLARREDLLTEVAREATELGGEALPLPVDVTERSALHARIREGEAALGPTDLLVANAGIRGRGRPGEVDGEQLERVFSVNVLGAGYAVEAVLPGMLERGRGHIIGISSLAGYRGLPTAPAYSASKAALTAWLEALRGNLRGTGVDVTVIHPGFVRTPMTEGRKHPMPFLMELDGAVEVMMRAVRRRPRSMAFPFGLATIVRAARFLPDAWYDAFIGWMMRVRRQGEGG